MLKRIVHKLESTLVWAQSKLTEQARLQEFLTFARHL